MNRELSIGILGGGQLGMMLCQASKEIGINTHIYCPDEDSPAKLYSNEFTCKDYLNDKSKKNEFFLRYNFISQCSKMIKKDFINKHKINFY